MTFAVMAPDKTYSGVHVVPQLITDDEEAAKRTARRLRDHFTRKGWRNWAGQVKIQSPRTPQGYMDLADLVAGRGYDLDVASQGNGFAGPELINWANILRERADELANPYCDD